MYLSGFNYCNCNYILFTKLDWPGDSEETFRSSSQVATCLPHTVAISHRPVSFLNVKQRDCEPIFIVFGLTQPKIVSVADALSTRPLNNGNDILSSLKNAPFRSHALVFEFQITMLNYRLFETRFNFIFIFA